MTKLKELLAQMPEPINQAGLHPTADMIELYAYYLPNSTFFNLLVSIIIFTGQNNFVENFGK